MPVGRERQIQRQSRRIGGVQGGGLANEVEQAPAEQGFPSGESDFLHPERNKQADHARVVLNRKLGILRAVVARSAVNAAVVAAVRHGEAQVRNRSAVAVSQTWLGRTFGFLDS